MFSKTIIEMDSFLDMSLSAQALYFHLGMRADDDGFVSPKMVMRMLGSTEDDLKILKAKGFIIPFDNGVIVIRHWKDNNYIRKDTYSPTIYQDELKLALSDEMYARPRAVDDSSHSIGKVSIDKLISSKKRKLSFRGQDVNINYGKYQVWGGGKWVDLDPRFIKEVEEK